MTNSIEITTLPLLSDELRDSILLKLTNVSLEQIDELICSLNEKEIKLLQETSLKNKSGKHLVITPGK